MKKEFSFYLCIFVAIWAITGYADPVKTIAPTLNGIEFPVGYETWQVISLSHRTDNDSMRVILGNPIAIQAARSGQTNPWPEGAILAKTAWNQQIDKNWPAAVVPGEFLQVEFMIKNSKKYTATKGWGFARWRGKELKPWGEDAHFAKGCVACHTPVADRDYVFTTPAVFIGGEK